MISMIRYLKDGVLKLIPTKFLPVDQWEHDIVIGDKYEVYENAMELNSVSKYSFIPTDVTK